MFFMEEYEMTESDISVLIQESVHDEADSVLKEQVIEPIFSKLKSPSVRKSYIELGSTFIESNADMLAKEYPTKVVSFPRKYVDNVLGLFGFTTKSMREIMSPILKKVRAANDEAISRNPTNIIHAIVLYHADMILSRELRDSARQQLGLSMYSNRFNVYFKGVYDEGIMAYTYMSLNGSWGLVKSENMVNWIGATVDTVYACWRTRLSVGMSTAVLAKFINAIRASFNQNLKTLSHVYFNNLTEGNSVGKDVKEDDEYVVTNNFTKTRDDVIRLIRKGDTLYRTKSNLYTGIAKYKNVKTDELYNLAQKVDYKDMGKIIDGIFYVFLVKEGHSKSDINSSEFITRLTKLPTAVDRAIEGKPIILPMSRKYNVKSSIVIAYICLLATYIMRRIDEID